MRFLVIAAVLASAAAAPSGLFAGHYAAPALLGHGHLAVSPYAAAVNVAPVAHVAPALPTISPGDLQGAAIEAHVEASDHARAAVDAAREWHDQASEVQGQAINAAEDHSWQAIDAVKTAEAQLDGQAAGVAPILAKQLAGHVAPVAAIAPAVGYAAGPAVGYAAGPAVGYAAGPAVGYAAGPALHAGYATAPAIHGYASSQSVATQSLSQTHPAPLLHAPVLAHGYSAVPHGYAHAW